MVGNGINFYLFIYFYQRDMLLEFTWFMVLQIVGTIFTHHQKCVLVDTQAYGNNRKITAFLGGLDLCDGRYDTPEHRLFRDLDTVYKEDFHNPTFPVSTWCVGVFCLMSAFL